MLISELVLEGWTLLIGLGLGYNSILNWAMGSIKPHGQRVAKSWIPKPKLGVTARR